MAIDKEPKSMQNASLYLLNERKFMSLPLK